MSNYYTGDVKVGGLVLDLYDDIFKENLYVINKLDIPAIVKKAEVVTPEKVPFFGDGDFALIFITKDNRKLRKYLISDPANTWISIKYFLLNKEKLPYDAQVTCAKNLASAANKYQLEIPLEIDILSKELFPDKDVVHKEANTSFLADSDFGIIRRTDSGKRRLYPITNEDEVSQYIGKFAEATKALSPVDKLQFAYRLTKKAQQLGIDVPKEMIKLSALYSRVNQDKVKIMDNYPVDTSRRVKLAAKYFEFNSDQMSPAERYQYADELTKVASELGVNLKPYKKIVKYSSKSYDAKALLEARDLRKRALEERCDEESLVTLGCVFKLASITSPSDFSRILDTFDRGCQLDYYWGRSIPYPDDILKEAKEQNTLVYNGIFQDWVVDKINKSRIKRR